MKEDRRDFLIKVYHEREGMRYRFTYLLSDYKTQILAMVAVEKTNFQIGDMIEEEMKYKFAVDKYNRRDPFYRAIDNFIKKNKPKELPDHLKRYPLTKSEAFKSPEEKKPIEKVRTTGRTERKSAFAGKKPM